MVQKLVTPRRQSVRVGEAPVSMMAAKLLIMLYSTCTEHCTSLGAVLYLRLYCICIMTRGGIYGEI